MTLPSPTTSTFDPKLVTISFMGIVLSEFADGTFVTVKQARPSFKRKVGAQGSTERINSNAFEYDIEFVLQQTSPSNGDLSAIALADKLTNSGKGELQVSDLGGTSKFFAASAWIETPADMALGDDLNNKTWKLHTGLGELFNGGN